MIFETGRNHLIDLDDPDRLLAGYSNDEIKSGPPFPRPGSLTRAETFRPTEEAGRLT